MPRLTAASLSAASTLYLPLVQTPDGFDRVPAIWPHGDPPAPHEVALFRHTFSLGDELRDAELAIFADTRYEAWIDGNWIGRGPARFSRTTREYDVYRLGPLQPGTHVIAVLVQWAPNTRRSESAVPALQARVVGYSQSSFRVVSETGPHWKALLSDAWQQDPAPVHKWGLVGPTELLDLRKLPPDWTAVAYRDDRWPAARVQALPASRYAPRSIPPLANLLLPLRVVHAGSLSPGFSIAELAPQPDPYLLQLDVSGATTLIVNILDPTGAPAELGATLDGAPLEWRRAGEDRPDVYQTSAEVGAGSHDLLFNRIPASGLTLGISKTSVRAVNLPPLRQGSHAGRRLLLADLEKEAGAVAITAADTSASFTFAQPPSYAVVDLGRTIHGRVSAEVTGPAGSIVDIGWDERLWKQHRPLPYPGSLHSDLWNQTDSWVLDGTARTITTVDARGGRYLLIAVWGRGPVELRDLKVYEERYPVAPRGTFNSSDELLNNVWQIGVDTLYPNMVDAYTDTPWRERGQWWGDAFLEYQINRVVFGDRQLLRRGLLFMAEAFTNGRPVAMAPNGERTHMLDYGMLWVQSLYDYYQDTGDLRFVAITYPVVREFIAYLQQSENPASGLLDIVPAHWSETVLIDWAAGTSRYGQSTAVNAMYYGTLSDAANLAAALGDAGQAVAWSSKARDLESQINARLYLAAQHRYAATIYEGRALPPSPHAQAWALSYGVVPDGDEPEVAASLLELLVVDPSPNVDLYGMYWVLRALGRAGRVSEATGLIEEYYGPLLEAGTSTWWETYDAGTRYSSSLSHGWGSAPTWFLTTYVAGVQQTAPDRWSIRPALRGLEQVSAARPIGDQEVAVRWARQGCERSEVSVVAPPGTAGEVILPAASGSRSVTLNGNRIWEAGISFGDRVSAAADGIHVELGAGTHELEITHSCLTSGQSSAAGATH